MEREAELSVEVAEQDGVPVIRAHGEIDVHTLPEFERAVRAGIGRGGSLVVDLTDISYLDSAGLSALVAAHRKLSARDAALYIVAAPGRPVARVLQITRLDTLFHVCGTVEEAIREAKQPPPA